MAVPAAERDFRGPGCDARCRVERVLIAGRYGRSDLLVHAAEPHEQYGLRLGTLGRRADDLIVRTGALSIDLGEWTATVEGEPVYLTPTELRLLMVLARRPGLLVPHADVMTMVWGSASLAVSPVWWRHCLRVAVSRLRRRLGSSGGLVVSVYDQGLKLVMIPEGATPPPYGGRWASQWDACRRCGRSDREHNGRGLCTACHAAARMKRGRTSHDDD